MTSAAAAIKKPKVIHPRWVRVTHWLNALAMIVMIGSGWQIYNASPSFDFVFPRSSTLGGWLAGRQNRKSARRYRSSTRW